MSTATQTKGSPPSGGGGICAAPCSDAPFTSVGKFDDLCEKCATCLEENPSELAQNMVPDVYQQYFEFCQVEIQYATQTFTLPNGDTTKLVLVAEATLTSQTSGLKDINATRTTLSAREGPTETGGDRSAGDIDATPDESDEGSRDAAASDTPSQAWIAGPVVGSIAGVLLILGAIFFLYRRRRGRRPASSSEPEEAHEKAQLHGDCIPPTEKYYAELSPEHIYEMDAGTAHEMNAVVAQEKETVEKDQEVPGDVAQSKGSRGCTEGVTMSI